MADLQKVYTFDDINNLSIDQLQKFIVAIDTIENSLGPLTKPEDIKNYIATIRDIEDKSGSMTASEYIKSRIAQLKNNNTTQVIKGAVAAAKNVTDNTQTQPHQQPTTADKIKAGAMAAATTAVENIPAVKAVKSAKRIIEETPPAEQETPIELRTDAEQQEINKQFTKTTGQAYDSDKETTEKEKRDRKNATADYYALQAQQKNNSQPKTQLQSGGGNGNGNGSSSTTTSTNMDVKKAGEIGSDVGDNTANYMVSVNQNEGYNGAAQLAAERAKVAAAGLIGGDSKTNANRKGPNETLRLSRLAEALNAREWTPGYRGQVASLSQQAGGADIKGERKAPINTAEMRQQQRTEGYEQSARDIDYNILKIQQQYNAMKAANIDDAVINAYLQAQMTGVNQMYSQNMYAWQQQADLNFARQKALTVEQLNHKNPEVAAYLSAILGTGYTQDIATADYNNAYAKILEKYRNNQITEQKADMAIKTIAAAYLGFPISQMLGSIEAYADAAGEIPGVIKEGVKNK